LPDEGTRVTHPLYESVHDIKSFLSALSLVQARVMPLFLLAPFMNRSMVPRTMGYGFAAGVGLLVAPMLMTQQLPTGIELLMLLIKEASIGIMLGYLVAIPFWIMEAVGFIVDNQRGASMAATLNPMTGHDSSPLGLMVGFAFITFFFVSGGLQVVLGLVYDSYRLWPPLEFWPHWGVDAAELLLKQFNRLLMTALLLAAPVLVAMFLSELGLALVSRFAPQLQVFFLAMPIKSALGIFVLILYATTLFDYSLEPLRELKFWASRLDPLLRLEVRP
jgi:type III secretion protein T